IRGRLLKGAVKAEFNANDLLKQLDKIGVEMGRSASNINQLTRHANMLAGGGLLAENVMVEFNPLFAAYIKRQNELEKLLRQMLRLMSK
ncbi:MAG TPA: plasmid mobilization relaxosome protein MobC, partial [Anseongella sp.]